MSLGSPAEALEAKQVVESIGWKFPEFEGINVSSAKNKEIVYTCIAFAVYIYYTTKNFGMTAMSLLIPVGFSTSIKAISAIVLIYGYVFRQSVPLLFGLYLVYTNLLGGKLF